MRHGMHYAVLMLVFALFVVTAPAGGQASMERPTYTAGDFWAYDLVLPTEIDLPENTTVDIDLTGDSRVTIQGSEMRTIRGEARSVYEATHALEVSAEGSVSIDFLGEFINATFTATVTADETAYLDMEGLEVWERHTEFVLNVSAQLEVSPGVTVSTSIEANGTVEMAMEYTTNTWGFPLTVGQTGEEGFNATGTSFFQLTFFDNTTSESGEIAFDATSSFEALREETITVPAGQFSTIVVANTPGPEETPLPVNVSTLAYWSSAVGAPVRYAATNETGEVQVEFVLSSYRYQVAESLSILGLDIAIAIPILVGIAAVAIILAIVLSRRRRPAVPPPSPPPSGGP
ncbi:MAG: hypothetical protein V3U33_00890 [candidate division NC10 bacterium]